MTRQTNTMTFVEKSSPAPHFIGDLLKNITIPAKPVALDNDVEEGHDGFGVWLPHPESPLRH